MTLNSVDLPQPEGPMIETNSPGATRSETSSTARMSPSLLTNFLVMCSTASNASATTGRGGVASSSGVTRGWPWIASARRNLDQLGQLLLGQRRGGELQRHRV